MKTPFQKRSTQPRLSAEEAARQGRVSQLAFSALRQPQAVIAFLNTHNDALGGRPIDLAVASAAGLLSVEQALAALPPSEAKTA
ncbi:antitoxin Xre/MbcA/ParS toxin-binding domain-containing protein [Sphingomonas sp. MMS24-J13]|uniref:antitoxin Xre/MbcA/ParS toxin-binding domain-containing protein n=1 Tax=Sphingomonas sp. MMS24-J13 TaxID=3238686 RepID=UPI00384C7A11